MAKHSTGWRIAAINRKLAVIQLTKESTVKTLKSRPLPLYILYLNKIKACNKTAANPGSKSVILDCVVDPLFGALLCLSSKAKAMA